MRKAAEEKGGTATRTGLFDNCCGAIQTPWSLEPGTTVRSGILHLLATMSDVTIAQTTTDGSRP